MGKGLTCGLLLKEVADGVEQKMGFLEPGPRLWSADSLRDISRKVLVAKLPVLAAFTDFSTLESKHGGGTLLLLEG